MAVNIILLVLFKAFIFSECVGTKFALSISLSGIFLTESISASTQMLYDVYENTIGVIEELEKHEEHGMSAGNSGLLSHIIPKHRKKDKEDVSLSDSLTCTSHQ